MWREFYTIMQKQIKNKNIHTANVIANLCYITCYVLLPLEYIHIISNIQRVTELHQIPEEM